MSNFAMISFQVAPSIFVKSYSMHLRIMVLLPWSHWKNTKAKLLLFLISLACVSIISGMRKFCCNWWLLQAGTGIAELMALEVSKQVKT